MSRRAKLLNYWWYRALFDNKYTNPCTIKSRIPTDEEVLYYFNHLLAND